MITSNFEVIIVGGGPVGLTAAQALSRADIDFVLLESRPEIVIDQGSNLVLTPMGMRVLGQLGLLDDINAASSPHLKFERLSHNGKDIGDLNFFTHIKNNHGVYARGISRHDLTKTLFESLPAEAKAKAHAGKKVCNITHSANSVTVTCTDGTSYNGSILIGADGAHSAVRRHMRRLALAAEEASPSASATATTNTTTPSHISEENPFLTTYRAIWVRFPTDRGVQPGDAIETHGYRTTVQLFAGHETAVIGVYERLDKPTATPPRYTDADLEAFIDRWGHLPIVQPTKNQTQLTIRDAYEARVGAGIVNLEEGVVKNWSWDRIVLVGDAAHKFTPSTGAGCNNGIVDIVVLANELHRVIKESKSYITTETSGMQLSKEAIASAFQGYQEKRFAAVTAGCNAARNATDTATWATTIHKFTDKYVVSHPWLQKYFANSAAPTIALTPVLNYVQGEEKMVGKVPWVHSFAPTSVASH